MTGGSIFHSIVKTPPRLKRHAAAGNALHREARGGEPRNRLPFAVVRMDNFGAHFLELSPQLEDSVRVSKIVSGKRECWQPLRAAPRFQCRAFRQDDPLPMPPRAKSLRERQ